jgi:hypothetical protein
MLKVFDKIQNVWKGTATYMNPAFHSRNFLTNIWQNYLAGVKNPLVYKASMDIHNKLKNGVDLLPNEAKIWDEYLAQGTEKVGWSSGDMEKTFKDSVMSAMDMIKENAFLGVPKAVNKIGGEVGQFVEGTAKLAHFISKRAEGLNPYDAGMSVKKYLFDYQDLTNFERDVLKRVVPFYTWSRKNIPLQLEAFVTNPGKQLMIQKIKDNIEVASGPDSAQAILPDWLKSASPIYVGEKNGMHRYIKLDAFAPINDLIKLKPDVKNMLEQVSPILKLPIELALNKTFFMPDQDISVQKGLSSVVPGVGIGEKDFFGTMIPGKLDYLARLFRPISEIEKIAWGSWQRKYSNMDGFERAANTLVGGKVYEYDPNQLMKQFKFLNEKEANDIHLMIGRLRKQIAIRPELGEKNTFYIQKLNEAYIKARMKAGKNWVDATQPEDANGSPLD